MSRRGLVAGRKVPCVWCGNWRRVAGGGPKQGCRNCGGRGSMIVLSTAAAGRAAGSVHRGEDGSLEGVREVGRALSFEGALMEVVDVTQDRIREAGE